MGRPSSNLLSAYQAYDGARVYLAKWARVVAEEGERARRAEVVLSGPGGRSEDSQVGAFEVLSVSAEECLSPVGLEKLSTDLTLVFHVKSTYHVTRPKSTRAHGTPIVDTEWAAWFDDSGKLLLDELEAKKRIFQRVSEVQVTRVRAAHASSVYCRAWRPTCARRRGVSYLTCTHGTRT